MLPKILFSSWKSFWLTIRIALVFVVLSPSVEAVTQNYRLILTENPGTSITIGWELIAGCPDTQRIYFDTIDHGQDTAAYQFQVSVTASYFHQGMENYFSTLNNLKPDTYYYFVIAEDEGISNRYWFQTLSKKKNSWKTYWTSPDLHQKPDEWRELTAWVAKNEFNFLLMDGLSGFHTKTDWREWLENWQSSISASGRMTPLLIIGSFSSDIQYLFNLPEKPLYTYQLSSQSALVVLPEKGKLKRRHLKKFSPEAVVIGYSLVTLDKIPEAVDINLTSSSTHYNELPNQFGFPDDEMMVELHWKNGQFSVQSGIGKKIWEVFSN